MKVYKMNDCDWVATNLTKEETNDWYKKEYGLSEEEQPLEGVEECNIDKEGLYVEVSSGEALQILDEFARGKGQTELKFVNHGILGMYKTFKEELKEYLEPPKRPFVEPFIIASTEY